MEEDPGSDVNQTSDTSVVSGASHKKFMRSISMSAISGKGSGQRGSLSRFTGGHSQIAEGIPNEVAVPVGDGGYRAPGSETVNGGFRHARMSSRVSSQGSSISISCDSGDRLVDAINLSYNLSCQIFGFVDSSWIAQAGDSGDRVVVNAKEDVNDNLRSFLDKTTVDENGVSTIPDDVLILWNDFWSCTNSLPPVSPLAEEIMYPFPMGANLYSPEKNPVQFSHSSSLKDNQEKLPRSLDYMSYMIHLAVFAELGVFTRHLLQKLFGPGILALTGSRSPLYLDLPANMLGSFLMGWFGVVFKGDIRNASSDHIVVGLTTGYLGSLTTFSGWNQQMLDLSFHGKWVFAVAGIIFGMILVNESIRIGVESAEALRKSLLNRYNQDSEKLKCSTKCNQDSPKIRCTTKGWSKDGLVRDKAMMIIMSLILLALWGLCGFLLVKKLDSATNGAILWLGLLVGPPGAWVRWFMARLNGQGIGKRGLLKWLPMGTLLANVLAACLMATLALINQELNQKGVGIILRGIQFGFLGCLSTVSTFVAEVYAMRQSGHSGRAIGYAATTIILSFAFGSFIYFDII